MYPTHQFAAGPQVRPTNDIAIRRFAMYLMHENLARAHMDALQDEARSHAQANRLSRAARLQRRADQLAQRAQQASARLH